MSVSDELTRIQGAKASLKTSITNKGVEVPDTALIDAYPALVDQIQTGGGGDIEYSYLGCESHAEALYLENIMSEDILTLTYKGEL